MTKTDRTLLEIGYSFISMIGFVFIGMALLFFIDFPVTRLHYPLLSLIGILVLRYFYKLDGREIDIKRIAIYYISFILLSLILGIIANNIWDFTVDGRWYHSEAIIRMSDGWNPIYAKQGNVDRWSYYYSKATWYFSVAAGKFLGAHEKSKIYTMLFEITVAVISVPFFKSFLNKKNYNLPVIGTIILILNPINWAQRFTFYQDAVLGMSVVLMVMVLYFIWKDKSDQYRKTNLFVLFTVAAFLSNIKFTGLVFASFILFVILIREYRVNGKKRGNAFLRYCLVSFFVITLVLGFSPYVKNTIEQKNPLYPLIGKDSVDIMTSNTPASLRDMNYAKKFVKSLLIVPDNDLNKYQSIDFKDPSKLFKTEGDRVYAQPDQRIKGYGILSFIVLPLSMLMSAIYIARGRKCSNIGVKADDSKHNTREDNKTYFAIVIIQFAMIALASREIWWARYLSYYWLIPAWTTVIFLDCKKRSFKYIGVLMSVAILINSAHYIFMAAPKQIEFSNDTKELVEMAKEKLSGDSKDQEMVDILNQDMYRMWYREKLGLPIHGVLAAENID